MPNWMEGSMKLRGNRENVKRFLKEAVSPVSDGIIDIIDDGYDDFEATIFGTHYLNEKGFRALIDGGYDILIAENPVTICLRVRFAWTFVNVNDDRYEEDMDNWKKLSEKYDLDFRLYGFERGGQFAQELIVERGKEPVVKEWGYNDWEWDCPFPYMGG